MTLWDFLSACKYDQELYIYLTNNYAEYLPVYHGTKEGIDFWEDDVFEVLQNKIEVFEVLPDGSIQVDVRDADFDKPMREKFTACKDRWDYWKEHPNNAPWGSWTDTETYCQAVHKKSRWFRDIRDCGKDGVE